jgi:hypothetical protein
MTWFPVDDKAHSQDAFRRVGLEGCGLYAMAGSYCCDQLTDGHVPQWFVTDRRATKAAQRLVDAGLWWVDEAGDYRFDVWPHSVTRSVVEAKRKANREQLSRWRNNTPSLEDG